MHLNGTRRLAARLLWLDLHVAETEDLVSYDGKNQFCMSAILNVNESVKHLIRTSSLDEILLLNETLLLFCLLQTSLHTAAQLVDALEHCIRNQTKKYKLTCQSYARSESGTGDTEATNLNRDSWTWSGRSVLARRIDRPKQPSEEALR